MKIKMVDGTPRISIWSLVPYENNARINDCAVPALCASIKRFGFTQPILITRKNEIVAGHTRVKAAKKLGMDVVPCVYVEGLTDEEVKALRLADNKVAEQALWDYEKLEQELNSIGNSINMEDFGFTDSVNPEPFEQEETEAEEVEREGKASLHKCPKCGEIFED